jgi:hypothetical protein
MTAHPGKFPEIVRSIIEDNNNTASHLEHAFLPSADEEQAEILLADVPNWKAAWIEKIQSDIRLLNKNQNQNNNQSHLKAKL